MLIFTALGGPVYITIISLTCDNKEHENQQNAWRANKPSLHRLMKSKQPHPVVDYSSLHQLPKHCANMQ